MVAATLELETYDRMKGCAAEMGMTLFGLRFGKLAPEHEKRIAVGKAVCDMIAKGRKLVSSDSLSSFENIELRQEFMSFAAGRRTADSDIATMANEAASVSEVLDRITLGRGVEAEDLDRSIKFFKSLYYSL